MPSLSADERVWVLRSALNRKGILSWQPFRNDEACISRIGAFRRQSNCHSTFEEGFSPWPGRIEHNLPTNIKFRRANQVKALDSTNIFTGPKEILRLNIIRQHCSQLGCGSQEGES